MRDIGKQLSELNAEMNNYLERHRQIMKEYERKDRILVLQLELQYLMRNEDEINMGK